MSLQIAIDRLVQAQTAYYSAMRDVRLELERVAGTAMETPHDDVLSVCAEACFTTVEAMRSKSRTQPLVDARHAAVYVLANVRRVPGREISNMFDRSPTYGHNMATNARQRLEYDRPFRELVKRVMRKINEKEACESRNNNTTKEKK